MSLERSCSVPDSTNGSDDLWVVWVVLNLAAQALHVHINQASIRFVLVAPHLFQQHVASEHLRRAGSQRSQQVELERGQ